MFLKKCEICGCFYASEENICINCKTTDLTNMNKLKNYFEEYNNTANSIEELSLSTGISPNNLTRYLSDSCFDGYTQNFNLKF